MTYDAVLIQKPLDTGLTLTDVNCILQALNPTHDETMIPIEVCGEQAAALGFISCDALDATLDFDTKPFADAVSAVLNDKSLESGNDLYNFAGINTLLTY